MLLITKVNGDIVEVRESEKVLLSRTGIFSSGRS